MEKKWTFESTQKAFEFEWTKKVADDGDFRAMVYLSRRYLESNNKQQAQAYLLKAVELSYIEAIEFYIMELEGWKNDYWQPYGFEVDFVKAYALTAWLVEIGKQTVVK